MFSKSHWITEALTTAATLCIASLEYLNGVNELTKVNEGRQLRMRITNTKHVA